jgi:hypothetical protein
MQGDRTNHFLTTEQVASLKKLITDTHAAKKDPANTFSVFIMALWRELLGQDCFDDGKGQIQVTTHAIQRDVSLDLLQHLIAIVGEQDRARVGLNYVNIGPSTW